MNKIKMALSIAQFPAFPSAVTSRPTTGLRAGANPARKLLKSPRFTSKHLKSSVIRKASEDENAAAAEKEERVPAKDEMAELGKEIKQAMKEREEKEEGGFVSGVVEEIREIEWPAFSKVLGTTGVVLGVIAGSSVVLLTVNAVLAEISDRVFAGKGVQDFFG